ncbi:MAG: hypothetical protein A2043_01930 [Candidatus Schekmanbacteria bacterium GWA2_38_9]|nr:MAG: hypothetical protein A2043_01930 [Candidatus Schekmanbacteria bacterium GWA2_38_9]
MDRFLFMISEKYLNHFVSICLILAISFAVYSNSLKNDFVNYDDSWLVLENKKIKAINFDNICRMFSEPTASDYLPLKELSYALDYHFWRLKPLGFHLTNVILFMINCLLVYLLTLKIFEDKALSFFSSLLFTLHPIHAEAVNWISARKDVLSGMFFFLSLLFYVLAFKITGIKKNLYFISSIISFIFALFSKPSVIILPFLLPLFDYCFLAEKKVFRIERTIIRILPFLVIAGLSTIITLSVASEKEVVKTYWGDSPYLTFLAMLGVVFDYIKLLLFPINLNVRYEVPFPPSFSDIRIIAGAILLIAFIVIFFKFRKNNKLVGFCLMWFLITLIPVSNLIPIAILKADRYLYLPSFAFTLGLSLIIFKLCNLEEISGTVLSENILSSSPLKKGDGVGFLSSFYKYLVFIIFFLISLSCFVLTFSRNTVWKDGLTLWLDTIKKSPEDCLVHNNLGTIYIDKGDHEKGLKHIKEALEINPYYWDAHFNLATIYSKKGKYEQALKELKTVLELNPNFFRAYINAGNIYRQIGATDKAIEAYKKAIEIDKKSGDPHYNLALLFSNNGLFDDAVKEYKEAIKLDPTLAKAYNNLGNIYFKKGLFKEAIEEYKIAVRQNPNLYEVYNNLGSALNEAGNSNEAIKYLKIAARLKKTEIIPHLNLGKIYMEKKMFKDAIEEFERVLDLKPDYYQSHISLGLIFLSLKNKEKAIEHFIKSLSLNPKDKTSEEFLKKINPAN